MFRCSFAESKFPAYHSSEMQTAIPTCPLVADSPPNPYNENPKGEAPAMETIHQHVSIPEDHRLSWEVNVPERVPAGPPDLMGVISPRG